VFRFGRVSHQTRRPPYDEIEEIAKMRGDITLRWKEILRAIRGFFYGMTVHELTVETRHARGDLDNLFMLVIFGDLVGLPILPPYYSMRLLPHIIPTVQRWKRRALRERDLTDMARVDI
jgi:hypothetical protein